MFSFSLSVLMGQWKGDQMETKHCWASQIDGNPDILTAAFELYQGQDISGRRLQAMHHLAVAATQ